MARIWYLVRMGKRFVGWSLKGTIRLYDSETMNLQQTLTGHSGSVKTVSFSP